MAIATIIGIIVFVVLVVLIIKFIKNTIKAVLSVIGLILIFLVIGSSFLYLDITGFRENFGVNPNLYLLEKNNQIIAGASGLFLKNKDPNYVEKEQLSSYQESFNGNDLKTIKGDKYYKLFVIKSEAFDSINEVKTENEILSREAVFDLLDSDTPVNDYLELKGISIDQRGSLLDSLKLKDKAEFKGLVFTLLFQTALEKNGAVFIFAQYKKRNIIVYPDSILFKAVKIFPASILDRFIKMEKEV